MYESCTFVGFETRRCVLVIVNVGIITSEVEKLGLVRHLPAGQRLFSFGDVPDSFFLILKETVSLCSAVLCGCCDVYPVTSTSYVTPLSTP
jgi:hypothetical protein